MSKTAKSTLQTNTTPNQSLVFKNHIYTMGAAFAGVVFGVLGSMGFVGNYMDSQFAAQTAALDKRLVAVAPASLTSPDGCYGTSTASTSPVTAGTAVARADVVKPHVEAVGGRGGDGNTAATVAKHGSSVGGRTTPFVSQLITGSISNTGPNSSATINASNDFDYTVTNNNNVNVTNSNSQTSTTGAANTSTNTNGGASTTGASHNTNSTTTVIGIDN